MPEFNVFSEFVGSGRMTCPLLSAMRWPLRPSRGHSVQLRRYPGTVGWNVPTRPTRPSSKIEGHAADPSRNPGFLQGLGRSSRNLKEENRATEYEKSRRADPAASNQTRPARRPKHARSATFDQKEKRNDRRATRGLRISVTWLLFGRAKRCARWSTVDSLNTLNSSAPTVNEKSLTLNSFSTRRSST